MNIRQAVPGDLEQAVDLLNEFKAESLQEYGMDLDLDQIRTEVSKYIGTTLVAEDEGGKIIGIIAGTIMRLPIISTPIYLESVWYVTKTRRRIGLHLMKSAEEFAIQAGCSHMIMAHMLNSKSDKLAEFYKGQGFVPYEINFIKTLTPPGGNHASPSQPA